MRIKVKHSTVRPALRRWLGASADCRRAAGGFTLVEVLIATAIVGLVFGGVINCYIQSGVRIEWTGYSLAAQSLANQKLEQVRAGNWDPTTGVNNLTNLNLLTASYNSTTRTYTGYTTSVLDVPYSSTNYTMATNFITVQLLSVGGVTNVQMQFVRVDTVWPFNFRRGGTLYFTNTISTMVAPDDHQF
jgi:prepilin-type N-terminal cleavage/methylation domain-containing protein